MLIRVSHDGFLSMLCGMNHVAPCGVSMVCGLFVLPGVVMLGGFSVVMRRMREVF